MRLLPLKTDEQVYAVLCLRITNPVPWFAHAQGLRIEQSRPDERLTFFWTFLEEVTSLLERARLRSEALHSN